MRFLNPYIRSFAVALLIFGIFRGGLAVIRTKNAELESLRAEHARVIDALAQQRDAEIANLNKQLEEARRKPYNEDLAACANQLLDQMTLQGAHMLRQLLMRQLIEVGRPIIDDLSIEQQHRQMEIAMRSGIVRHQEQRNGGMLRTYWEINPEYRPVLQDVLYRPNRL